MDIHPAFIPERKGILKEKRIVIIAGEDFEDVELCIPAMEFVYRGARVILATFLPPVIFSLSSSSNKKARNKV